MQFNRGLLSNDELKLIHRDLLLPRMIEEKMLLLLRQGRTRRLIARLRYCECLSDTPAQHEGGNDKN